MRRCCSEYVFVEVISEKMHELLIISRVRRCLQRSLDERIGLGFNGFSLDFSKSEFYIQNAECDSEEYFSRLMVKFVLILLLDNEEFGSI